MEREKILEVRLSSLLSSKEFKIQHLRSAKDRYAELWKTTTAGGRQALGCCNRCQNNTGGSFGKYREENLKLTIYYLGCKDHISLQHVLDHY